MSPLNPAEDDEAKRKQEDALVEIIRKFGGECATCRDGPQPTNYLNLITNKTRGKENGLSEDDPDIKTDKGNLAIIIHRVKKLIKDFEKIAADAGLDLPLHLSIPRQSDGFYRVSFKPVETRLQSALAELRKSQSRLQALERHIKMEPASGSSVPGPPGQTDPPASAQSQSEPPDRSRFRSFPVLASRAGWLVAAAAIIFAIAISIYPKRSAEAPNRSLTISIPPPPDGQFVFGNNVGGIALSPDGNLITYIAWTEQTRRSRLWVRSVDDADGRALDTELKGTDGAAYPFWSPDSRWIGFFADGKLKKVQALGTEPEVLCDVAIGRGGAWAGGEIIFGSLLSGLSKVSDRGGKPVEFTELDQGKKETGHSWPQMLPDGRVLYWVRSNLKDIQGAYITSISKPNNPKLIRNTAANAVYAQDSRNAGHLLWLENGELHSDGFDLSRLKLAGHEQEIEPQVSTIWLFGRANLADPAKGLLLFANFSPRSQFRWFSGPDWKGESFYETSGSLEPYTAFRLSPDGRIAVSVDRPGGTDLLIDITTRRTPLVSAPLDPGMNSYPVWSPDSRAIVYTNPNLKLCVHDMDAKSRCQPLTSDSLNAEYPTDWSNDKKWILYWQVSREKPKRQIWALSLAATGKADQPPQQFTPPSYESSSGSNEAWARFCPGTDPQWVVYQSDNGGRPNEVYARQFRLADGKSGQASKRFQISTGGGEYPVCSPDGQQIYYLAPDNFVMQAQLRYHSDSIDVSQAKRIFPLPGPDNGWPPFDVDRSKDRLLVRSAPVSDKLDIATRQQLPAMPPLTLVSDWTALPRP